MRVNPPIEIGRSVLRKQSSGLYAKDWIRQALLTVGLDKTKKPPEVITEQGVLVWGSDNARVDRQKDVWINYVHSGLDKGSA